MYCRWTQLTHKPTPLGIIYDDTDLNHLTYPLYRDSVPLCQNVSNTELHQFDEDEGSGDDDDDDDDVDIRNETELEHCLLDTHGDDFRWDDRNFTVDVAMIDAFIRIFVAPYPDPTVRIPLCIELLHNGEKSNFVLANVWCRENETEYASLHHYYREKKSSTSDDGYNEEVEEQRRR